MKRPSKPSGAQYGKRRKEEEKKSKYKVNLVGPKGLPAHRALPGTPDGQSSPAGEGPSDATSTPLSEASTSQASCSSSTTTSTTPPTSESQLEAGEGTSTACTVQQPDDTQSTHPEGHKAAHLDPADWPSLSDKITPKKLKSSNAEQKSSSPQLSDEQLDRMAKNKKAALEKRRAKQTPAGFGETWRRGLAAEFQKPYFKQMMSFVDDERSRHTVYPPAEHVFSWTEMCDIQDVKVVILGQDPYHGPKQAHGLCFSVQKPVPPPPSLVNIYKELCSDIDGFKHPGHGDLTGWAKQGVLLLNAVLTVRAHQANSHKDRGWECFTDAVVGWLSSNLEGVVFLLWGSYAHKKGATIDRKRHHVLSTVHPSPLSAHRGFLGCKHFSKANELLKLSGKEPINWRAL